MKEISFIDLMKCKIAFKKAIKCSLKSVKYLSLFEGGMSNRNYLFQVGDKKYVVHVSAEGYDLFVDRENEIEAMNLLKDCPISQKPVYLSNIIRIFNYVEGESMNKINYLEHLEEISNSFHKIHKIPNLKNDYKPFNYIESLVGEINEDLDPLFIESWDLLSENRKMLEERPLVFSHNDLQPSNLVLDKDGVVQILDFEFAKNNDYLFDLATFGNLNFNDSLELLKVYEKDYTNEELNILKLWRILVNIQWYLVAIRKHELGYDKKLNMNFKDISLFFLNKNRDIIDSMK